MTEIPTNIEIEHNFSLDDAIKLAETAHEGQVDKVGKPYINHPTRVMKALEPYGEEAQIVGELHDIVEDTDITLEDLKNICISENIIVGVDAITKRKDEKYEDAINRVKQNKLATLAKIADNRDNCNKKRLEFLPDEKRARFEEKYTKALAQLIDSDEWLAKQVPIIQRRIEELYDLDNLTS